MFIFHLCHRTFCDCNWKTPYQTPYVLWWGINCLPFLHGLSTADISTKHPFWFLTVFDDDKGKPIPGQFSTLWTLLMGIDEYYQLKTAIRLRVHTCLSEKYSFFNVADVNHCLGWTEVKYIESTKILSMHIRESKVNDNRYTSLLVNSHLDC